MTKEEKIKFLAELDGWKEDSHGFIKYWNPHDFTCVNFDDLPHYLTNYNEIIRLIQKQPRNILTQIVLSMKGQNDVSRMVDWLMFSPEELADILIGVTQNGKSS